jgi:hypothetical protein
MFRRYKKRFTSRFSRFRRRGAARRRFGTKRRVRSFRRGRSMRLRKIGYRM